MLPAIVPFAQHDGVDFRPRRGPAWVDWAITPFGQADDELGAIIGHDRSDCPHTPDSIASGSPKVNLPPPTPGLVKVLAEHLRLKPPMP